MTRPVTEADFRQPEFRDANVDDYEFRSDGKLVRKDRWEMGIRQIVGLLGMDVRDFEIDDVVNEVKYLANALEICEEHKEQIFEGLTRGREKSNGG